jgi:hypothetical protein
METEKHEKTQKNIIRLRNFDLSSWSGTDV